MSQKYHSLATCRFDCVILIMEGKMDGSLPMRFWYLPILTLLALLHDQIVSSLGSITSCVFILSYLGHRPRYHGVHKHGL